jgi:hypothetical protein
MPTRFRTAARLGLVTVLALGALSAGAFASAQGAEGESTTPPPVRAGADSPTTSAFVPITPCRLVNSQNSAGAFADGETRSYNMFDPAEIQPQGGNPAGCGIPAHATGLELSITSVLAEGEGYLRIGPNHVVIPTATFHNYSDVMNATTAGSVRVTPGQPDSFKIRVFEASTHVVVDALGYYVSQPFAVIDDPNGDTNLSVVRHNGVTQAQEVAVGSTELTFNRDITGCGYQATIGHPGQLGVGGPDPGYATVTGVTGEPTRVRIRTFEADGDAVDRPYHLQITC